MEAAADQTEAERERTQGLPTGAPKRHSSVASRLNQQLRSSLLVNHHSSRETKPNIAQQDNLLLAQGHPLLILQKLQAAGQAQHTALETTIKLGEVMEKEVLPRHPDKALTRAHNLAPMIGLLPPSRGIEMAQHAVSLKANTSEIATAVSLLIASLGASLNRLPKNEQRALVEVAISTKHFQHAAVPEAAIATAVAGLGAGLSALSDDLQERLTDTARSVKDLGLREKALAGLNYGAMMLPEHRTAALGLTATPREVGTDVQQFATLSLERRAAFAQSVLSTKNEHAIASVIGRLGDGGMLDELGPEVMAAIVDALKEIRDPALQGVASRGVAVALGTQAGRYAAQNRSELAGDSLA